MKLHSCLLFSTKSNATSADDNAIPTLSAKTSPPSTTLLASEASTDSNISLSSSSFTSSTTIISSSSLDSHASLPSLRYSLLSDHLRPLRLVPIPLSSLKPTPSSSLHVTSLAVSGSRLFAATGHRITVYDSSASSSHLIKSFNSDGGSSGSVKSIAFSDGRVLTAHQDGKICVWKQTGERHKLIATLPTVTDRLRHFAFPDSYVQVRRHKKRLWLEHNDAVSGLAVNNGLIYSVSWDKTMKVWRASDLRCLESVRAHDDAVNAIAVSRDGIVFTGSADKRIRVWAIRAGEAKHVLIATLERHRSAVNALALSSDGSALFSGACDRSILVWERVEDSAGYMAATGALRGHDNAILCLVNVSDLLFSGSADRTVRIWGRGTGGQFCCLTVLEGHLKPVKSVTAMWEHDEVAEPDDAVSVFSGSLDGEIKVWRVKVVLNEGSSRSTSTNSPSAI